MKKKKIWAPVQLAQKTKKRETYQESYIRHNDNVVLRAAAQFGHESEGMKGHRCHRAVVVERHIAMLHRLPDDQKRTAEFTIALY